MTDTLRQAEELEAISAAERVAYFSGLFPVTTGSSLLDVGCGNGYSVQHWREAGVEAFGVDVSLYRLSRWVNEHPQGRPFVVADATALPFKNGTFDALFSSGMIEHVGVSETSQPYAVSPHSDRDDQRRAVIGEFLRVCRPKATLILDFPNGRFPIDFWHGDEIASFRVHSIPDDLLPSMADVRLWAAECGSRAGLKRLQGRLRFLQVRRRWWGRIGHPAMRIFIRFLDMMVAIGASRLVENCFPYLVVQLDVPAHED